MHNAKREALAIVQLYAMDCRETAADFDALTALISEERASIARARGNTVAGRQSLAAGLLLRAVFGAGKGVSLDAFGKPHIAGGPPCNLSHAGDYAVLATSEQAVGVDLERIRKIDVLRIAARFFHPEELAFLQSFPDPAQAFFCIWTLKESYVKALGRGFSLPLSAFCVLPQGTSGAMLKGNPAYCFHRYGDAFPGYCLSVCAMEDAFPSAPQMLLVADAR